MVAAGRRVASDSPTLPPAKHLGYVLPKQTVSTFSDSSRSDSVCTKPMSVRGRDHQHEEIASRDVLQASFDDLGETRKE